MTKKHENLMIFQCFQQSDSPYLFYVTCLWNRKLVNVCWPSRSRWRSNRNLLTVACNCSILVILFLSANSIAPKYLKNCYTYSFYTSHTGRPLSNQVQVIFFELMRIVSRDLERIMGFQFFLNISKTYNPIFNFNTSIRRSLLVLYFIFFDLRPLANLWERYGSKTVFLIVFGI